MFFASLGLSGVGFTAVGIFSKYTRYFLILTFILLGLSHYLVAKNGKKTNKIILWVATFAVLAMVLYTNRVYILQLFY